MSDSTDPLTLLKAVSPLLNVKGGVLGVNEMERVVKLMKESTQLVSRCVYLNIIKVTDSQDILEKFITDGGWAIMNTWLVEAKNSENMALILEVLKILQELPLRINHLKQNNTPKLVKSFVKTASCSKVKTLASTLMSNWLGIIKDASGPADSSKKKVKSKTKADSKCDGTSKKSTGKPPPISKAPSFASFRKTGLETAQEPKKVNKSDKGAGAKRGSLDGEPNVPIKKLKLEPKQQKKISISAGFMDALNSVQTVPKKPVKRKPVNKPKLSAVSPNNRDKMSPAQPSPVSGEAGDFTGSPDACEKSPSPVPAEPAKPKLNKYGKPMKTVRWMAEERLESIRYFEKEEGERVNVTTQSFKDALRRERISEREKLGDFHHQGEGFWKKPKLINLPTPLVEIGSNSVEKHIQLEREKSVLQEIFLSIDMVPDYPAEPDPEPYELIPPKIIPIDDPNDPGPLSSRSPSPYEDDANPDTSLVAESNPDILKDKLREIIQTATANSNPENVTPKDQPSPTTPMEMHHYPPMMHNGDPNQMYPAGPPMMAGPPGTYYPDSNMSMHPPPNMPPPGVMMPGPVMPDVYADDWGPRVGHHRPMYMEPRNGGPHRGRPPPQNFRPDYRGTRPWRPQRPWREQGPPPMPGMWSDRGARR